MFKRYLVMLRGEHFPIKDEDGNVRIMGFVTSRTVFAQSPDDAEVLAVKLIKNDASLMNVIDIEKFSSLNPPSIYLVEMSLVSWWTIKRKGYVFFEEGVQNS
ncbi:hypothetical protein [Shewanella putrefaciens]|uniref:hypothetical protein n=1 Tax=Shewanella putrefaciens TaxID=24 RepID=UPI003564FE97